MVKVKSLQTLILFPIMMILFVSACGSPPVTTIGATYQPPFAPVIFMIDSSGTISIQGNLSMETPIGRFGIEANIADNLQPENNSLLLIIRHQQNGKVVDDAYKLQTGQDEVRVVTNGTTIIDVRQHKVFIDASKGTIQSIEVQDANSQSTSTNSSPIPAPTPTLSPTPIPSPTPLPQLGTFLYQANWSNGLNGWNGTDEWYASDGILKSRGNDGSFTVQPTLVAPYFVESTNNYAVQARIRIVSGDCVFISLRGTLSADTWNGYKGVVCGSEGNVRLQRNSDQLVVASFNDSSNWHIYRVEIRGSLLRLFIDGGEVLRVEDNQIPTGGQVGLKTWNAQVDISALAILAL